jgi:hypothetical protein
MSNFQFHIIIVYMNLILAILVGISNNPVSANIIFILAFVHLILAFAQKEKK